MSYQLDKQELDEIINGALDIYGAEIEGLGAIEAAKQLNKVEKHFRAVQNRTAKARLQKLPNSGVEKKQAFRIDVPAGLLTYRLPTALTLESGYANCSGFIFEVQTAVPIDCTVTMLSGTNEVLNRVPISFYSTKTTLNPDDQFMKMDFDSKQPVYFTFEFDAPNPAIITCYAIFRLEV